jgi:aquaporin Z
MRRYLTEFIGTLLFVFCIGMIVTPGPQAQAPLMIGVSLMVLVYMGGHVSGAHYNPAVTLAVFLRGKLPAKDVLLYMASQFLGGIAGAYVAQMILGQTFAPTPGGTATTFTTLLTEAIFTFLLALVVLNVATSRHTQGNSFYGLAIGFVIAVAVYAGGPVSGGVYNPAVGFGSSFVNGFFGGGDLTKVWFYLVGPFLGGAVAALVFKIQEGGE